MNDKFFQFLVSALVSVLVYGAYRDGNFAIVVFLLTGIWLALIDIRDALEDK